MVIRYFQYPVAAFEIAARIDSNRYGDRKRKTVRPETAKGAVADLYFILDQSQGGTASYSARYWAMRWDWTNSNVQRLLDALVAASLLELRTSRNGTRTITRPKRDGHNLGTKQPEDGHTETKATSGTGGIVGHIPPRTWDALGHTVSSKDQRTDKKHSAQAQEGVIAKCGNRKRLLSQEQSLLFLEFWAAFADQRGRAEAAWAFSEIDGLAPELVRGSIIPAAKAYAVERVGILNRGGTPKMAQGWLNGRRWEDYNPAAAPPNGKSAAEETREKFGL